MFKFTSVHDRKPQYQKINELILNLMIMLESAKPEDSIDRLATYLLELILKREELSTAWSVLSQYHMIMHDDDITSLHTECLQKITQLELKIATHDNFYKILNILCQSYDQIEFIDDSAEFKECIEYFVRNAKRLGIELSQEKRADFLGLQEQLSLLSLQFQNNEIDVTAHYPIFLSAENLTGCTASQLSFFKFDADRQMYLIPLSQVSYKIVLENVIHRDVREHFYKQSIAKMTLQQNAEQNNSMQLVKEILSARTKSAKLLGFESYRATALADRFAKSEEELDLFYDKLFEKAEAAAHRVRDHVLKPLAAEFGLDSIQPWDMPYLLRYATERRAQFSQEELREYFPLEACLQRLFDQYAALYGISFAVINNPTVWHESVKGFIVYDRHSNILGEIYCDFFARPFKAEGAWMQYVCNKSDLKSHKQHSVVILVMNFSQDLLLIDEVCTLYHEFGHGFHQLFSTKKYPLISGIENVPWDIVELPSQLSEQWFLMKESLEKFLHPTKQTPLSPNIIEAILTNEQAFGPIFILRQLMLGFFDWKIHGLSGGDCDPHEEWLNIQKRWSITPVVDRDYRWADFGHLFAGGYAAGYYGYLYSEVFVHDVFQRMRKIQGERSIAEAGADFYDAFLCQAADRTLRDKLDNFLGGAVKLDPFLKHYGLIDYV